MSQVPYFMTQAGLSWRWAEPEDLVFVNASWFASSIKKFIRGPEIPMALDTLSKTIQTARRDKNEKMLRRIWHTAGKQMIAGALASSPTLVVFDIDDPHHIIAWGHSDYCYTKQLFRHQGISRAIRAALAEA